MILCENFCTGARRAADAARTAVPGPLAAVASDPLRGASAGSIGTGTPGRLPRQAPDKSNALAEGILPDQGVCLELSGVARRLQHTNRYATVLTCGFLLPLTGDRRAASAGSTGSSR